MVAPVATPAPKADEVHEDRAKREDLQATAIRSLLAPLARRAGVSSPVRVLIRRVGFTLASSKLEAALEGVRRGVCDAIGVPRWSASITWALEQEPAQLMTGLGRAALMAGTHVEIEVRSLDS